MLLSPSDTLMFGTKRHESLQEKTASIDELQADIDMLEAFPKAESADEPPNLQPTFT